MTAHTPGVGRIAVYSCYLGKHEPLNTRSMGNGEGYDRFLCVDDPEVTYPGASLIPFETYGLAPQYASRIPKIRPHLFFAEYDWVIYVDNRANLLVDPQEVIARVTQAMDGAPPAGRYLFPHTRRSCPFKELRACWNMDFITAEDFHRTRAAYRRIGLARQSGLFVNTMMIQKMGGRETDALNDLWWELFLHYCKRDQLTLPYALKFHPEAAVTLPMPLTEFIEWPVFSHKDRVGFRQKAG